MTKLMIYAISILASTFAVSGINFDHLIKKNHIWEARFLSIIFILPSVSRKSVHGARREDTLPALPSSAASAKRY